MNGGDEKENWREDDETRQKTLKIKRRVVSRKRRWMESEMDRAGEFNGERGDVVHPCTASFAFKKREGVSRQEKGNEGRGGEGRVKGV